MSARRDDDVTIEAMLDAATAILSYTANQSLETFLANRMMRNAVAKNLEVLGEGAAILSLEIKEKLLTFRGPISSACVTDWCTIMGEPTGGGVGDCATRPARLLEQLEVLWRRLQNQPPESVQP